MFNRVTVHASVVTSWVRVSEHLIVDAYGRMCLDLPSLLESGSELICTASEPNQTAGSVQYGLLAVQFKVHHGLIPVNWFGTSLNLN
jgi:hypothetical protein